MLTLRELCLFLKNEWEKCEFAYPPVIADADYSMCEMRVRGEWHEKWVHLPGKRREREREFPRIKWRAQKDNFPAGIAICHWPI
jgi:hypothetical protein